MGEAAQQQQQRSAGKRSAKGAELESGSNVVPRQMERQQSNTLHTPNISNSLSTGDVKFTSGDLRDLSAVLKNCPEATNCERIPQICEEEKFSGESKICEKDWN